MTEGELVIGRRAAGIFDAQGLIASPPTQGQVAASKRTSRDELVVDEEAGVVIGMGVFNRPPGAARANGTLWPRNLLTEVFAIESGKIAAIHAAMHYLEPDVPTAPGW